MAFDEEELMRELRAAVRSRDAVTDRARVAAQAAFAWRTIDEELLSLTHDATAGALVRAPDDDSQARILSFQGAQISMEVEVTADQLIGQVLPGQEGRITLESPNAPGRTVAVDATGFFEFPDPPTGPVRLKLDAPGSRVTTPWLAS